MSDEEMVAIFKERYGAAYSLNEYIWGKGIEPGEYDSSTPLNPYYVKVKDEVPYRTKAELKAAIADVYVSDLVEGEIRELLFTGYGDNGPEPRYSEADGVLTVDVKHKGFDLVGKFLPETAKVKRSTATTIVFDVIYERDGKQWEESVMMKLEDGVWRFEAPMY